MRAVSLTESALLIMSAFWQTNAVALRAGGEVALIDSPYLPDELDALPSVLAGSGYEPNGLIATHGDFDHLLGRVAYPGMALGVAESTALRFRAATTCCAARWNTPTRARRSSKTTRRSG